ncbi:hypothetical protein AWB69_03881 [Caballeronia udeis]|uniref:Uncharacterized protein n=1 Tax=Caballeronia udeis TaxID=1232866 RepID=A0A158H4J3_9BURK|nr:zinc ribbon domain-containing protein [Caballeronia udeis]SAL39282.1 hypothetical protein AWB69_03881 [Caballeronia udeis]
MFFVFIVGWLFFIIITALIASSKNRSAGGWAALGALFGIFATVAIACCSKLPTDAELAAIREASPDVTKVCPRCAEKVKVAALACRFCNYEFDPASIPKKLEVTQLPWTLVHDHGGGYGVYSYRGDKLIYSSDGVKWKTSSFDNPAQAIAAVDGYR